MIWSRKGGTDTRRLGCLLPADRGPHEGYSQQLWL